MADMYGRDVQPELVASAQELMRMLQVIEGEILPRTAKGVAAGNKASPTLLACIPPLRRPSRWPAFPDPGSPVSRPYLLISSSLVMHRGGLPRADAEG
jgi:hypothetical protein